MGTKFGHISIFDSDLKEVKELLKFLPKDQNTPLERMKMFLKRKGAPDDTMKKFVDFLNTQDEGAKVLKDMTTNKRDYYIRQNNRLMTVYSEEFSIGVVDDAVEALSQHTPKMFLATSLFDESVFTLSLVKNRSIITRHFWGETQANYEMEPILGDAAIFAEAFGISEKTAAISEALQIDNLSDQIDTLSKLFNVELWINLKTEKPGELTKAGWKKVVA
jgi:hypothetical protein